MEISLVEVERMSSRTRIKLIASHCSPEQVCREWAPMAQDRSPSGGLIWNDIEVTWEDRDIDFYVIVNHPWPGEYYDPARTIIFQMEPWCAEEHQTWGVKTWGEWSMPDPARFLQVRAHRTHPNVAFWQMQATYQQLATRPIAKSRVLAAICSPKYFDPGHILRVDFLKFIERKNDDVVRVDLYAYDNPLGFTSWVGPIPPEGKEAALLPYKYFFTAENNSEHNFITEKLWEPLLSETLCFYWGCPNVADWVDRRAFIALDLDDFEAAFQKMKRAILANEWEKRLDVIRREKRKVLDHYQFFPTLERILHHEMRLPLHPSDSEVAYHKYFSDALGEQIKTAAFIHSFTKNGDITILTELLDSLDTSGLLDRLDRLYVVNCGDPIALSGKYDRHAGRIRLINYSRDASRAEAPTLTLIRQFAQFHDQARILYLHTKGASHPQPTLQTADWRRLMLHFVVEHHEQALAALAGADAVGCNLTLAPRRHFSGNFWWAKASYLAGLAPVPDGDRHEAEWWVLSGQAARAESLHDSGVDHHHEFYGRAAYAGEASRPSSDADQPLPAAAGRASICLVMIARNEATIIGEGLASALPFIADYVVVDTGSSDGTQEAVRRFFARHGVPGQVVDRPWRDFGSNRSEALALAREISTSDYLWMMDADDVMEGKPDLGNLTAGAYHLRFGPDFEYWRLQLFRRDLPWKYVGVLHEYPACDQPAEQGRIEGDYRMLSRRLGSRNRDPDKYQHDAAILEAALARDPENTRHAFYLAQSLFDAKQYERALAAYGRRIAMGGWQEEVFYSRYRSAMCLEWLGRPAAEAREAYEECFREHPHRAEPLVRAAALARKNEDFFDAYVLAKRAAQVAKPAGGLFVQTADYDYRAQDEQAIAAYYCDFPQEAFDLATDLLDHRDLPDSARARIEANRDYAVPRLKDDFLRYDADLVARIAARQPRANPRVTLSITSCRRLPLFIGTVSSFLNACTDIDLVDRFICVDDGSSESDRAEMQRRFPFFEFIWKGPADKGHVRSMNLIREAVRTPWLIHLEDDWQFFARRPYIGEALEIFEENPEIGQVLFNRNYAETLDDRDIGGGVPKRSDGHGYRYLIHEYYPPKSDAHRAFTERHPGRTSAWWPHFSFRPSMVRTSVFAQVGRFDESVRHFEHDYARRFFDAGLRAAFFDGVYALHTGRLTSQRDDPTRANAYELNGQAQFNGKAVESIFAAGGDDPAAGTRRGHKLARQLGARVINLDRRPDRLQAFQQRLLQATEPDLASRVERFAAIDGRDLSLTAELQHLFRGNDFSFRRAVVATALSHMGVWRQLAESTAPAFLILEDDVAFCPGFEGQLVEICGELTREYPAFDVVLLGYFDWRPQSQDDFATGFRPARLQPFDDARYLGGTFGYLLSRRGAEKLIAIAERDGIQNGIDRFVHRKAGELEILVTSPKIVEANLVVPGSGVDSDIQNDFTSLPRESAN
jgi:GR25 family glycosyltransferase involved in LPS biosynthesis/glycosyltransferase involved in cell wall biosynthesis/GT2 family glycosyltransferase